ncbi:hypothetical protein WG907_13235 [Sphingobium sp. AN558]|uniref:hypothetical protein n=1 Tax=Sphingobium sp. AN558 TaxID=3133442 RepID=UPI0030C18B2B
MRRALVAGGLALLLAPTAQPVTAPASAAPVLATPTKADLDAAAFKLRVIISALQSPSVETPLKNILFACLYENAMGQINAEADKVIVANKLDRTSTSDVLTVVAGVCGYRPPAAAATKPR